MVAKTADTAKFDSIEMAVAAAINENANCGEYRTLWNGELPESLIEKLKNLGYKVCPHKDAYSKDVKNMYIISCR